MNTGSGKESFDNRGFTLLELIISMAIMAIIILICGQFMVTSANTYSTLQRSVSLSQASKQVSEQMSENSLDSSAAVVGGTVSGDRITFDGKSPVYFVEYTGKYQAASSTHYNTTEAYDPNGNLYIIRAYKYDDATKTLLYGQTTSPMTLEQAYAASVSVSGFSLKYETLCENFDDNGFSAYLEVSKRASDILEDEPQIVYADRFSMSLSLKKRDKKFKSVTDTTFRGRTVWTENFKQLSTKPYLEEVNER
ncbi:MAG: prepilin-type N-terminal cleavage/methylation domain-containing protein [Lachnospiraceae bacterium]|nr:prepilin-type N-terminal cleavage/methylation domain-containing protein [Lachnospiraceae bacterium]